MALETGTYISDLVITNPVVSDGLVEGDDHLRLIKSTLKSTFPNVTGAVNPTQTELNYVVGATSALQPQITSASTLATAALPKATVPNVVATMNASSAELNYSVGVTSLTQTQLNTHTTNITTAQTTANNALPKAGGTVTGALTTTKAINMSKGASVASAATMDIWTPGDGNTIHGTGTSTITSFGTAPQAGADRWLIADAAFVITNNASIKVQGAATYTASVDDVFHIIADTTTVTYVEIFKANGQAIVVAAAGYTKIIKATTETRTTTTLTSDTEFTFSMLANTNYRIKYRYLGTLSSAAGAGADVALVTPTSPTSILHSILISHGTAILNTQGTTSARLPNNGYGAASVTFIMDGEVILKNGVNAGTFALQTALNSAAGTLTFQLGSSMTYETF